MGRRILLVCALLFGACGESASNTDGTGGIVGTGGNAGSGGMAGAGGMAGSGGMAGAGGDAGAGGGNTSVDLVVTPFISGLTKPWDIAWLPNGTVLVTERSGPLNVYVDGVDSPSFAIAPTDLVANGEGGMLGLEVDPDFANNGYVYVCMASDAGTATDVRLVRYELQTPNGDSVVDRTDIVTGMPYSSGRHSGCRPRFGPDDYLWVGTGDAAIGTTPQDDDSLGGKVLRIDRNGNAAPDNPSGRRWFSKGHRNIQGMAFRASDDLGVSAEHGPLIDDEVNLLVAGNFGWDPVPTNGGPQYNESVPMTDLVAFPDAIEAIWSSGSSTLALSGATFIEGSQWGDWDGVLAVATLKAAHLHVYSVSAQGEVTNDFRVIEDRGRLRSPRQGPDGLLYITNDGGGSGGQVLQVSPLLSP
ncbi:MAG: PQQ-dependent sugar dehydrogenase [Myxococcales bacterium]|nr:PQQ-dependent sugar dehydrogenase [Myxococcales bacterium]